MIAECLTIAALRAPAAGAGFVGDAGRRGRSACGELEP